MKIWVQTASKDALTDVLPLKTIEQIREHAKKITSEIFDMKFLLSVLPGNGGFLKLTKNSAARDCSNRAYLRHMKNIHLNESFGTLSETINGLAALGYTHDFNLKDECLVCHRSNITLSPDDFQIDKVYRFEGDSDPEYQSILYAISSIRHGVKGTLVNGYGTSADEVTSKLVEKLNTHAAA